MNKKFYFPKVITGLLLILASSFSYSASDSEYSCKEFTDMGGLYTIDEILKSTATPAQFETYKKIMSDVLASIAFNTFSRRAKTFNAIRNSKSLGLSALMENVLSIVRLRCFEEPDIKLEFAIESSTFSLLDYIGNRMEARQ